MQRVSLRFLPGILLLLCTGGCLAGHVSSGPLLALSDEPDPSNGLGAGATFEAHAHVGHFVQLGVFTRGKLTNEAQQFALGPEACGVLPFGDGVVGMLDLCTGVHLGQIDLIDGRPRVSTGSPWLSPGISIFIDYQDLDSGYLYHGFRIGPAIEWNVRMAGSQPSTGYIGLQIGYAFMQTDWPL